MLAYQLTDADRDCLYELLDLSINPYTNYEAFYNKTNVISKLDVLPKAFKRLCDEIRGLNRTTSPAVLLQNCPIDRSLPVFDIEDPLTSKYQLKKTYIFEAFLGLFLFFCMAQALLQLKSGYPMPNHWFFCRFVLF